MNTPASPQQSAFPSLIKRRRALAMASTAIGLAGCGALPSSTVQAPPAQHEVVAAKVKAFTSEFGLPLEDVDRERLRVATEKKSVPAAATNTAPAPVAGGQVILASAGGETAPAAHTTAGHPTEPAAHAAEPAAHSPAPAEHAPETPAGAVTPHPSDPTGSVKPPAMMPVAPLTELKAPPELIHAAPAQATASEKALPPLEKTEKPVEKAIEKATQATTDVSASPLSSKGNDEVHTAVITPVSAPVATPAAAMGAMNAVASAQVGTSIQSAAVAAATSSEPTVEEALATLKKSIAVHPTLSTSLALALLDSGSATDAAKGLSDSDQKVFSDLLGALETMKTSSPGATVGERAAPLVDAAKKWQADQDLSLPRLVLASRVDSFGVFTPVEAVFEQGKRRTVIIYCEVANFASQKGTDGWYTTHLTQQETLMTDDNLLVWRPNSEDVEDRSLNQRHDFYLVKKLTIPENLAAGKYTLVMNVADKISGKKNIITLPIEIK